MFALQAMEPGAHVGMLYRGTQRIAGVHEVAPLGVGTLGGTHGIDHAGVVHLLSHLGKVLSHADVIGAGLQGLHGPLCLGSGFGIKGVQMGHATGHEEIDHTLGPAKARQDRRRLCLLRVAKGRIPAQGECADTQ